MKLGTSKPYRHKPHKPIFGLGQGASLSAPGFTKQISFLSDIFDRIANRAHYLSPDQHYKVIIGMTSFIDDCNETGNGTPFESVRDVLKRVKQDAQSWNNLLVSMGGALNLEKFFLQIIHFQFHNGAPVAAVDYVHHSITLEDKIHHKAHKIGAISAYTPYRGLGTHQCVSSNQHQ